MRARALHVQPESVVWRNPPRNRTRPRWRSARATPAADGDETLGWVVSARWGRLRDPGDWRFDYYLAHIEAFAVNAAFAQDDWVRWGNGPQTEGTNARGHEVRVSYEPAPRMNIVARLYLVEAITSSQDGKRFRLDFNWSF